MGNLKEVWNQITWLHEQGISLIPVRDKQEGDFQAKTPYRGWKKYQTEQIPLAELWYQLEANNTSAVAIIAGEVSGSLEIIDIDVKYKPGIDAVIFSDLNKFYPELFSRLRIHQTPSGGYHILYRVADFAIPGNKKLAGRHKTDAELKLTPKPATVNFIETRGTGGYAVAPPSLGYTVFQDVPIPVITAADRHSIITLCHTYSEIIEIEKPPKADKKQSDYYDEDPFTHFNGSPAAEDVLTLNGWKETGKSNGNFTWYTRPGKDKGVSASFNHKKRVYYIFTSSTDLEESRGYNPATLVSKLQFNGDNKACYRWLVQNGYGKIKHSVEARIVKNNALSKRPLPPNASATAAAEYATELVTLQTTYPFGIFWERDDDNPSRFNISREILYQVADGLGWKIHNGDPVLIEGYIVKKSTERVFFDSLKAYIKEEDGDEYISICNAYESFIQKNGAFSISRLQELDSSQIVKDTNNSAYKFYNNSYLFITAQAYSFNTYDTLSGLIWHDWILPRQYVPSEPTGRYVDFIKLATDYEEHGRLIRNVIGYLSHQYKDEATGYIIVLTESCPDPKQGGGSGKNLFCNLFRHTTSYKSVPGSQVRYDEKFLQSWNKERIFGVSDAPKRFDFSFLKELATGTGILKKLFKDEVTLSVDDMPKFIIQTNFSYEVADGGLKRRIIPIEFTDFFTKAGGVDVHFGCLFPQGWELSDWSGYDTFIAICIQDWLSSGLKLYPPALTEGGWHKQFEQTYGQVIIGIIDDYFDAWVSLQWVPNELLKEHCDRFYMENNTPKNYQPAMTRITLALKEYCLHHKKQLIVDIQKKVNGINKKFKWFGNQEDSPF